MTPWSRTTLRVTSTGERNTFPFIVAHSHAGNASIPLNLLAEKQMQFNLKIQIDPQALAPLVASNQHIVFAKPVSSGSWGLLSAVWASIRPAANVDVAWSGDFLVFAANTDARPGVSIRIVAQANVQPRDQAEYSNGQFRVGPGRGGPDITIVNQSHERSPLSVGLAQRIAVNGSDTEAPINAMSLQPAMMAVFQPVSEVAVFLLSSTSVGTLLENIPGNALRINPAANLKISYDPGKNGFKLG